MLAKIRAAWTDPATWRNLAYLGGLFPFLWALDLAVLMVWLTFIGLITAPAWYWAPEDTYPGGSHHGLAVRLLPARATRTGGGRRLRRHAAKAIVTAVVFLLLSLLFQYVVVLTARMHARVAYSLLGAPIDPLAEARNVLDQPGPLGPLRTTAPERQLRPVGGHHVADKNALAHEGLAHERGTSTSTAHHRP